MHLHVSILSSVAFALAHSLTPLSRDFPPNIENTHYKYGYQPTGYPQARMTSKFSVQRLVREEREIYKEIRALLDHNSSLLVNTTQVSEYVKDYEESVLVLSENLESEELVQAVAGNLVSVYRMIRRFRNFIQVWLPLSQRHEKAISNETLKQLKRIYDVDKGPRRVDFHISMFAFPLLQFQSDIKADQIAAGIYKGRQTGVQMKAIHCLEIGLHSVASGFYPIGIEWIEHALEKVNHEGDPTVSKNFIQKYLKFAIEKHDANWQPFNELDMERVFYEKPLTEMADASQRKWQKKGNYSRDFETFSHQDYSGVCKGDIKQVKPFNELLIRSAAFCINSLKSELHTSNLYCWNEISIHPFWKLGPLKSELLTPLPDQIVRFHDVIRDDFTNELRKAAEGKFTLSQLSKFMKIHPRIEYAGTMTNLPQSMKAKLESLASRLTGLQVQESNAGDRYEPYELTSYIPGGFTTLHVDWASGGITNERLATFIIYLEGPEIGGSTGFPRLKMAAPAIKGSAIFWFNVNSAGEHAGMTLHGSCPVLIGSKWIALKWIPYVQQTRLKCDLEKTAGMDYLRNARSTTHKISDA